LLEVRDLRVSYGRVRAVQGVSLEVNEGEIVALIGANGAGKSSTMHAVCGIERPAAGEIRFLGRHIARLPPHRIMRRGIVQVPEGRLIFGGLTIAQNLRLGAYNVRGRASAEAYINHVLEFFPMLQGRLDERGSALSGGQAQMLALARGLMAQQVHLPEAGPGIAAQFREPGIDGSEIIGEALQPDGVDASEPVEGSPLHTALQQRLVSMLAVQVDQVPPRVGERAHGGQVTVDVGPRPSLDRYHPPHHDLSVAGCEAALDLGLGCARPNQRGVGAAAGEQVEGADHQSLARARLAGDSSHSPAEHGGDLVDHAEVAYHQLNQHRHSPAPQASDRPAKAPSRAMSLSGHRAAASPRGRPIAGAPSRDMPLSGH